jgi:putative salt-induced outer membrane protein YdiY
MENLNQNLKKSYEKGFFDRPSFDHFKKLREIRKNKDKDSVQSSENDDSEFMISVPKNLNKSTRGRPKQE